MITKISVKTNTNAELFSVKLQIVQKYAAAAADSHKSGHKSLHDLKNTVASSLMLRTDASSFVIAAVILIALIGGVILDLTDAACFSSSRFNCKISS